MYQKWKNSPSCWVQDDESVLLDYVALVVHIASFYRGTRYSIETGTYLQGAVLRVRRHSEICLHFDRKLIIWNAELIIGYYRFHHLKYKPAGATLRDPGRPGGSSSSSSASASASASASTASPSSAYGASGTCSSYALGPSKFPSTNSPRCGASLVRSPCLQNSSFWIQSSLFLIHIPCL